MPIISATGVSNQDMWCCLILNAIIFATAHNFIIWRCSYPSCQWWQPISQLYVAAASSTHHMQKKAAEAMIKRYDSGCFLILRNSFLIYVLIRKFLPLHTMTSQLTQYKSSTSTHITPKTTSSEAMSRSYDSSYFPFFTMHYQLRASFIFNSLIPLMPTGTS